MTIPYPEDPVTYTLRYQFLLGAELLVAPVLDRGAGTVRVYLPAGGWTHLWSDAEHGSAEGTWVEVAAPIGQPAIFARPGSAVGARVAAALRAVNIVPGPQRRPDPAPEGVPVEYFQ